MTLASTPQASAILWGLVLILAIVALGAVVWVIRKWVFTAEPTGRQDVWSLQHLRELKAAGQISDAEFDALKANVINSARGDDDTGGPDHRSSRNDRATGE